MDFRSFLGLLRKTPDLPPQPTPPSLFFCSPVLNLLPSFCQPLYIVFLEYSGRVSHLCVVAVVKIRMQYSFLSALVVRKISALVVPLLPPFHSTSYPHPLKVHSPLELSRKVRPPPPPFFLVLCSIRIPFVPCLFQFFPPVVPQFLCFAMTKMNFSPRPLNWVGLLPVPFVRPQNDVGPQVDRIGGLKVPLAGNLFQSPPWALSPFFRPGFTAGLPERYGA